VFVPASFSEEAAKADLDVSAFAGTDLHLRGRDLISRKIEVNQGNVGIRHTLVFRDLFSMSIGSYQFSSDNAVVWLESSELNSNQRPSRPNQQVPVKYKAMVYLQGKVSTKKTRGTEPTAGMMSPILANWSFMQPRTRRSFRRAKGGPAQNLLLRRKPLWSRNRSKSRKNLAWWRPMCRKSRRKCSGRKNFDSLNIRLIYHLPVKLR
jgi:hypothetical protein